MVVLTEECVVFACYLANVWEVRKERKFQIRKLNENMGKDFIASIIQACNYLIMWPETQNKTERQDF